MMDNYHIFNEKLWIAYVWFANAVASEGAVTDHAKRLKVARYMISPNPPFDNFVRTDLIAQGYDATTAQGTIQDRLSGLATNLVAMGFGD